MLVHQSHVPSGYANPDFIRHQIGRCHCLYACPQQNTLFLVTFKELVASFNKQGTSWEELCLEIRCESCFASVFDEVNEQMGSSSDVLARLADEFPNHYKSYAKERGLVQP